LLAATTFLYGAWYVAAVHGPLLYAIDDAYIGFATAKNLVEHGVWGVTRYEFSGASTSLLWPLLLAGLQRAIGLRTLTPLLLNLAAGAAMVVVSYEWLRSHLAGRWTRAAAALAIAAAAALPGLAFFGMEHALQCLFALAVAFAGVRLCVADDERRRRALVILVSCSAALAIATRYDTGAVVLPVIAILFFSGRRAASAIVAASAAAPAALYGLAAYRHGWPPVPVAVLEKVQVVHNILSAWREEPALAALVIAALVLWSATRRAGARSREPRLLLLVFAVAAALHVQFGRVGWPGRYESYIIALGVAAIASAWPLIGRPRGVGPLLAWATTAAALAFVARRAVIMHVLLASAGDGATRHEYQQGLFLARHPQRGAVMLVDLGAAAFLSDARIVDLSGLANEDAARLVIHGALTPDAVRALAAAHDVHSLIDVGVELVPDEWIHVADWESPAIAATFFAVDEASAAQLLADLRAFMPELPAAVVLRADMKPAAELRPRAPR
jgi:hypothetical protein